MEAFQSESATTGERSVGHAALTGSNCLSRALIPLARPLKLLPEFDPELHRLGRVDMGIDQAIAIYDAVALRVLAEFCALVKEIVDECFGMPVVQPGSRREVEGRE